MSTSEHTNVEAYRISTNISSGKVKDPVTGESHDIEATGDTSGEITVSNPYAAETLVEETAGFEFVDEEPADHKVTQAQKSALGMETVPDHILDFAKGQPTPLGEQVLDVSTGFDPETDDAYNGPRMKAVKMYNRLQSEGYTDEARYLRLLGNLDYQEEFADYVREEFDL